MKAAEASVPRAERQRRLIEQLGAPSAARGVAHARDLLEKIVPGALARARVAREDDGTGEWNVRPFIEQLGVASSKGGLRRSSDAVNALFGLYARWSVGRWSGVDYRARAYELIEQRLLQVPMRAKRKALVLSVAYAIAGKLPDTR